jgi:hypothetical protein
MSRVFVIVRSWARFTIEGPWSPPSGRWTTPSNVPIHINASKPIFSYINLYTYYAWGVLRVCYEHSYQKGTAQAQRTARPRRATPRLAVGVTKCDTQPQVLRRRTDKIPRRFM